MEKRMNNRIQVVFWWLHHVMLCSSYEILHPKGGHHVINMETSTVISLNKSTPAAVLLVLIAADWCGAHSLVEGLQSHGSLPTPP